MSKFSKGDKVNFVRNSLCHTNNTKVCAYDKGKNLYIIENEQFGSAFHPKLVADHKLSKDKKYIFASESELIDVTEAKKEKERIKKILIKNKSNGKKRKKRKGK